MPYIAVSGPGEAATSEQTLLAYQVGELLALNDHTLLTGGVNGAAAAGCRTAGGTSIGLLPGNDRAAGSPTHTLLLPTGLGDMRNTLLVHSADVVVAIGNSSETLSEAALALENEKPLIVLAGANLPLEVEETPFEELAVKIKTATR